MAVSFGECPFGDGRARIELYPDGTVAVSLVNLDGSPRSVAENELALGWVLALVASNGNFISTMSLAPEVARRWGQGVMSLYRWVQDHRSRTAA